MLTEQVRDLRDQLSTALLDSEAPLAADELARRCLSLARTAQLASDVLYAAGREGASMAEGIFELTAALLRGAAMLFVDGHMRDARIICEHARDMLDAVTDSAK